MSSKKKHALVILKRMIDECYEWNSKTQTFDLTPASRKRLDDLNIILKGLFEEGE